jgi:hypothetical protein
VFESFAIIFTWPRKHRLEVYIPAKLAKFHFVDADGPKLAGLLGQKYMEGPSAFTLRMVSPGDGWQGCMWSIVVGLQTNTVHIGVRLALLQNEYVAFAKAEATGK